MRKPGEACYLYLIYTENKQTKLRVSHLGVYRPVNEDRKQMMTTQHGSNCMEG